MIVVAFLVFLATNDLSTYQLTTDISTSLSPLTTTDDNRTNTTNQYVSPTVLSWTESVETEPIGDYGTNDEISYEGSTKRSYVIGLVFRCFLVFFCCSLINICCCCMCCKLHLPSNYRRSGQPPEVYLEIDYPNSDMAAGGVIKGTVTMIVKERYDLPSVYLHIYGTSTTHFNEANSHGFSAVTDSQQTSYSTTLVIADSQMVIWSQGSKDCYGQSSPRLKLATYKIPFRMEIPEGPSTYEDSCARVGYVITVNFSNTSYPQAFITQPFKVLPLTDLPAVLQEMQNRPDLQLKGEVQFNDYNIFVNARLQYAAYLPGDKIVCTININNNSSSAVNKVTLKFISQTKYLAAQGHATLRMDAPVRVPLYEKIVEFSMNKVTRDVSIAPNSSSEVVIDTICQNHQGFPSFECLNLFRQYVMEIDVSHEKTTSARLVYMIGTPPIKATSYQSPLPM